MCNGIHCDYDEAADTDFLNGDVTGARAGHCNCSCSVARNGSNEGGLCCPHDNIYGST